MAIKIITYEVSMLTENKPKKQNNFEQIITKLRINSIMLKIKEKIEIRPPYPIKVLIKAYDCVGKLLLPVVVRKLKVVILPVSVVQYCKHPFGGLNLTFN